MGPLPRAMACRISTVAVSATLSLMGRLVLLEKVVRAVQDKAAELLDRPAKKNRQVQDRRSEIADFIRRHDFELVDKVGKKHHRRGLVDNDSHGPAFAVRAHENERAVKPGIADARHGNKDLAFKVLRSSHGHNLSGN